MRRHEPRTTTPSRVSGVSLLQTACRCPPLGRSPRPRRAARPGLGVARFFRAGAQTDELTEARESGTIRPAVDSTYPLAEFAAAHRALENGGVRGSSSSGV
ncbi:hypothetical protein EIL87_01820 [Saccharopolyspora rhizosphaerae]|uniref:Uncharacterized protein n=1 Tax=Saccharopolyspora rhizosphaerae TaxID=2492662 RepID=A0A3R8QAK6_9PSEU|nr:zinc-binding dehydrogenase [Saccharopolyspora rhizosphaerae]RRO20634.1 hypothetical protein EIL87_01820 [Saccharopolyspora rhizosphaerae]